MTARLLLLLILTLLAIPALAEPATHGSLEGKVFTGYQGWFAPKDENGRAIWRHLGKRGRFEPGFCGIDLWPDVTELTAEERFPTGFKFADGRVADVFSSANAVTVERHFRWMKEYGIDGAFLQRFATDTGWARPHMDKVLANVRAAAAKHDRSWVLMYDLSGLKQGEIQTKLVEDFKRLVNAEDFRKDRTYLRHEGKPLVAVWGVGFNDGRKYTLAECRELVKFLKEDPQFGGNAVMLGVPYWWRELKNDAVNDPALHEAIAEADVVSPWAVGRLATPEDAKDREQRVIAPDVAWAKEKGIFYLPVVFPGFSFHNSSNGRMKLDQIPRLGGRFLWSQGVAAKRGGAQSVYVAMFDELDEGTAVFKTTADVPAGETKFVVEPGVPSDRYLTVSGHIGKLLRGEASADTNGPSGPVK
jgi:hypothetical protein